MVTEREAARRLMRRARRLLEHAAAATPNADLLLWPVVELYRDGQFVAGVSTAGDTVDDALDNVRRAIDGFGADLAAVALDARTSRDRSLLSGYRHGDLQRLAAGGHRHVVDTLMVAARSRRSDGLVLSRPYAVTGGTVVWASPSRLQAAGWVLTLLGDGLQRAGASGDADTARRLRDRGCQVSLVGDEPDRPR